MSVLPGKRRLPRLIFGCAVAMLGLLPLGGRAGIPDEEAQNLQLKANGLLDKAVKDMVDEKRVAARLFLAYPVDAPVKTPEQIQAEVAAQVKELASKEFAGMTPERYRKEAADLYSVFPDYVEATIVMRDGGRVSGVLRERTREDILIGKTRIKYEAIAPESLVRFDDLQSRERQTAYVNDKMLARDDELRRFEAQKHEDLLRQAMRDAGYLFVDGQWVSRREWYEKELDAERERVRTRLKQLVLDKVYSEAGYVVHQSDWMKPEARAEILKQQAAEEEAAANAAAALAAAAAAKAAEEEETAANGGKKPDKPEQQPPNDLPW